MHDRIEKTPKAAGTGLIPVGLITIIKIIDVKFLIFAGKFSWRYPHRKIEYRHKERMMAWRPTELHEFWKRMVNHGT